MLSVHVCFELLTIFVFVAAVHTPELRGEGFDSSQFAYGSVMHKVLSDLTSKLAIVPLMRRELLLAWSER